jgi:hypothetical protein
MSSFISSKNQEMLWKTIQKNPLFGQVLTPEHQPLWFREIIGNFYTDNKKELSNVELLELNKNTLRYMVHNLKEKLSKQNGNVFDNPINEPINDRIEPKSSSYQNEFEKLQNDYNTMHKRVVPREPNFKEEINDEKISNMDELIQQQLKERELDVIPEPQIQPNIRNQDDIGEPTNNKNMSNNEGLYVNNAEPTTNTEINDLKRQIGELILKTDVLENELKLLKSQMLNTGKGVSDVSGNNIVIHQ